MQKISGAIMARLVAFSFFTFLAVCPAFGQLVRAEIPYAFTFGSKAMPAGTYTFSVTNFGLRAQSATGEVSSAPIITRLHGPTEFLQEGSLVFDRAGGGRILSELWMPGAAGMLVQSTDKDHHYEILLIYVQNQNTNASGKVAYDRTCGRCHQPCAARATREQTHSSR